MQCLVFSSLLLSSPISFQGRTHQVGLTRIQTLRKRARSARVGLPSQEMMTSRTMTISTPLMKSMTAQASRRGKGRRRSLTLASAVESVLSLHQPYPPRLPSAASSDPLSQDG
jgi:hypothetical protein